MRQGTRIPSHGGEGDVIEYRKSGMLHGTVRTGKVLMGPVAFLGSARICLGFRLNGAGGGEIARGWRTHSDRARQRALGRNERPGKGVAMNELKSHGRMSTAENREDGLDARHDTGLHPEANAAFARAGFAMSGVDTSGTVRGDAYSAQIARAIESDIIPRLMMAYRTMPAPAAHPVRSDRTIRHDDIETLAHGVMEPSPATGRREVNRHLDAGLPMDRLLLDLLAPTAKRLGELWTEDQCDFAAVTIGLCRLQDILRDLAQEPGHRIDPAPNARVLLSVTPGEQHTFGVLMLEEFFRRAGYDVTALFPTHANMLLREVRANPYDVVGLSASCDGSLNRLPEVIRAIRRESKNSNIVVMVGGPIFEVDANRAMQVGADLYAVDGASALLQVGKRLGVDNERVKAF